VQLIVAWGEFAGGVALLLGFLTRLAALGEFVIQVGAIYVVTWVRGFSFAAGGGYEYNVVLLASCLALVLAGGAARSRWPMIWGGAKKSAVENPSTPTPVTV